ncbi:hypothetical protein [Geosporobacter ferrireducens]|uniref:Uncharacterized protein n=1 Tax=Geosporobacter ferrireducens TaxID=1424294 RepID=A0A1D8GLY1_9FIRM|nr:hypothetical protein [Geosporobacter ferrireducens]AOT71924.1 hypothetical protein Gferi_21720 [Geosporobacter ferrireducens]MTI55713.1 hypothetical protein [Geosporobacter ferrireducens]
MNTLYGLIHNKQYKNTSKADRKNSQNEALAVFNALTLKEKCLYLIKISKRNTSHQALVLMGLTLVIIAADYYLL